MDPITQASIGAAAAQSIGRTSLKTALLIGALGGFLPDSDVFIRSSEDPLLHLEYHRHFTHSLIFIPVGGLITAGIGQLLTRGRHRIAGSGCQQRWAGQLMDCSIPAPAMALIYCGLSPIREWPGTMSPLSIHS